MTVAGFRAHVDELAASYGVRLVEHPGRAHAHVSARYSRTKTRHCPTCGSIPPGALVARVRPVRSTRSYIVALHELGHLLGDRQHPALWLRLEREIDATWWAWRASCAHTAAALREMDRQALGYMERYPSWPKPEAGSHAWDQVADLARRPHKHERLPT